MPTQHELTKFYDGFLFATDSSTYPAIERSVALLMKFLEFLPNGNNHMLDIGGGGGHYSVAFEKLQYGHACYADLDPQACAFARSLGLKDVIHGNAENPNLITERFDLIFVRHVIEHLISPDKFMTALLSYLKPNGKLVIICPNAHSTEDYLFPTHLAKRIHSLLISNNYNLNILIKGLSKYIHHGIAPPRHLWAITEEGLSEFWIRTRKSYKIMTFPIDNEMVSPLFKATLSTPIYRLLRFFLKKGKGVHLMCIVQSKTITPQK